jgi:hypothetical protein
MYSPYMFKYFPLILRNMQKEWRLRRKKLLLLTMPDKVKGAVFRENQMGIINWLTENKLQILHFGFL